MSRVRAVVAALVVIGSTAAGALSTVRAADPVPPYITPDANWLTTVNYYRAMAGVPGVTENSAWSQGAYNHSCYMLYNGITHDEIPGQTGYTTNGDTAGNNGNVAVSSGYGVPARSHIELWMTGPFHAIGVLRHNLQTVGFGKCDLQNTPTWHSGATLNVLSGLGSTPRPTTPILFPGNGTTTNLNRFITESPNPLTFCGWTGSAGLPVIAMMPEAVSSATATMTGPNGPVQTCRLFSGNTTGTAQAILSGDNAVTVVPRVELTPGTYTVTITTQARTVTWSFTVDPAAATGVMPVPAATPAGPTSGYTPVSPFRFADSRQQLRITRLVAGTVKKIKFTGVAGLPTDAAAISANLTVVNPGGASYLTVYNCSTFAPVASTLNFAVGETVANAGVFPLSTAGELCVVSPVATDLVIDVNGHFRPAGANSFTATRAAPAIDTTTGLRVAGRLAPGSTSTVDFTDTGTGVPAGASAVAVNLTAIYPDGNGFVTAYPCGINRPLVSNVNPMLATVKPNFAIVPLSASGEMCIYASTGMQLKVDLLGYFLPTGTGMITPASPTRLVDTRDTIRTEMNLGTGGSMLTAGVTKTLAIAGQRGIPAGAKSLAINVTIVRPVAGGTITAWECGAQPNVASVTYATNKTVANGMQLKLSAGGELCVRSTSNTHLVIDLVGWWN